MSDIYKVRRDNLLKKMKNGVAIIASATYKKRSNDTEYPFRQDSNFYYLSGFKEDNSVLVLAKKNSKTKTYLFVEPKNEALELWSGKRLGVDEAKKVFDIDNVYSIKKFEKKIYKICSNQKRVYFDLFSDDKVYATLKNVTHNLTKDRGVKISPKEYIDLNTIIYKLRVIKSNDEIALIKEALKITKEAHHSAMMMAKDGLYEYEIQSKIEHIFKSEGAYSDAYTTIVAGANRANTLHYINNDQMLKNGDLVLIDAGCEYQMYASDITRTFPINGKFTQPQKELYEMVLDVQLKVIDMIKPHITKKELQEYAEKLLCEGMVGLGILSGDIDELIKDKKHKKYFPHGIGHWMGLDVHDPCPYYDNKGKDIKFKKGMLLTIEPAIYIDENDENVPKKYRGIGIRIEDNILVTEEKYENLSFSIVKTVDEIEKFLKVK